MNESPEFSRPQRLDTIGAGELRIHIVAAADELSALARRFELLEIKALAADYDLRRDAVGIIATGHVSAAATQACVVTGDPVSAAIEEDFTLRFLPEGEAGGEEIELDEGALDTMFYAGGAIDLGEAAAETFALALDPFPRSPEAAQVLRTAGVKSEDEAKPAGALAGLRDLLGKR